jgi:hypothetical protein
MNAGNYKTGDEFFMYYNSATHESPTWVFIPCKDVKRKDFSRKKIDTTQRKEDQSNFKIKTSLPSRYVELNYEVIKLYQPGETTYEYLWAAFQANAIIEFLDLDGIVTDPTSYGLNFPAYIFGMPMDEPMEEATPITFDLGVADTTWVPREWPVGS